MRRRSVIIVVVITAVAIIVFVARFGSRSSPRSVFVRGGPDPMPIYRPRAVVDPRMPELDSALPLRRDTAKVRPRAVRPPP